MSKFRDLKHPVDTSTQDIDIELFKFIIAPRKLFVLLSKRLSSVIVPGDITLTTSRFKGPFLPFALACSGVSVCSHTATLNPFLINLGR